MYITTQEEKLTCLNISTVNSCIAKITVGPWRSTVVIIGIILQGFAYILYGSSNFGQGFKITLLLKYNRHLLHRRIIFMDQADFNQQEDY